MPTYDYRCLECGHEFEAFQRMSDELLRECPECKGELKRLLGGGAGFIFKGSGFYTTDYRSAEYKKSAEKDGSSASTAAKSENSGSSKKSDDSGGPAKGDSKPSSSSKE